MLRLNNTFILVLLEYLLLTCLFVYLNNFVPSYLMSICSIPRRWVANSLDFNKDYVASVFETTIRLLYKDSPLVI